MRIVLAMSMYLFTLSAVQAAELKVLSGNGARAAVRELCAQFARATGHKVNVQFEVNAALARKIEAGESFDVAVLNPKPLDALIKQGKIVADSRAVMDGSGSGLQYGRARPTPRSPR